MDSLPDEILFRILRTLPSDPLSLCRIAQVNRRFKRIADDPKLWYNLFIRCYPVWASTVQYSSRYGVSINWKQFVLQIRKQQKNAKSFDFKLVDERPLDVRSEASGTSDLSRKRKLSHPDIEEPAQDIPSASSSDVEETPPQTKHAKLKVLQSELPERPASVQLPMSSRSSSSPPSEEPNRPTRRRSFPNITWGQDTGSFDISSDNTTPPPPPPSSYRGPFTSSPAPAEASDTPRTSVSDWSSHRELEIEPPFRIQDPLVVDIDRVTGTGIVATGKHRKERIDVENLSLHERRSEHKILFWHYPSWNLIREFDLSFAPAEMSCQITGIQSIRMSSGSGKDDKMRLFTVAVGVPLFPNEEEEDEGDSERVDAWQVILIYRLFDDGSTQCMANLNVDNMFLGREIFFFSDYSWMRSNDGDDADVQETWDKTDYKRDSVQSWLKAITTPSNAIYDPQHTVFMLAIGQSLPRISGTGMLIKIDTRGQPDALDPSTMPVRWDRSLRRLQLANDLIPSTDSIPIIMSDHRISLINRHSTSSSTLNPVIIATIKLGLKISCMLHFKYPPQLNHLIVTGSFDSDELAIYDWRFGVRVGSLPWTGADEPSPSRPGQPQQLWQHIIEQPDEDMDVDQPLHNDDQQVVPPEMDENEETAIQPPQLPDIIAHHHHIEDDEEEEEEEPLWEVDVDAARRHRDARIAEDDEAMMDEAIDEINDGRAEIKPWGLESTMVLPVCWSSSPALSNSVDLESRGFRLIAVGDNRQDKLGIKVWDISHLLNVDWDPLDTQQRYGPKDHYPPTLETYQFRWWSKGSPQLQKLALDMLAADVPTLLPTRRKASHGTSLPYSPPQDRRVMLLTHSFDKEHVTSDNANMPVKYTAYNVLCTSLFLLTEEGEVTVMDIETGSVIASVTNAASGSQDLPQRIRGIDVNVIAGKEIVVTSREGLLRGSL
ncbi:hypothetical protein INT44_006640 [Umbelopsis vinacea]|uniref:F-box domain-containing protein n=1 Tax=Umbelopsis vinacea TaxID=44442 RepID=A0A8H7PEH5_9FUNG|nr:hypothetical protein INT44_006640 [Umbelopsis vinacea]